MPNYGSGGDFTVTMDGPFAMGGGGGTKLTTITAPAANWKGGTSPYSQVIDVEGISVNSAVYIALSAEQIQSLMQAGKEISFAAENDGGIVTLYAVGDHPGMDLNFQAVLLEVIMV